jgi:hypothetical protein
MEPKHFWTVRCAIPAKWRSDDAKEYMQNHNLGVVATSIDRAIEAVRQLHPRAQIWAASHHGTVSVEG